MPSIFIEDSGDSVELPQGAPLTDLAGRVKFGCQAAACGTCALKVVEGAASQSPVTPKEKRAFERLKIEEPGVRLACQMKATSDCRVRKYDLKERKKMEPRKKDVVLVLSHAGQSFLEEWLGSLERLGVAAAVLSSAPKRPAEFEQVRRRFAWSKAVERASLEAPDVSAAIDELAAAGLRLRCVVSVWEAYRGLVALGNGRAGAPDLGVDDIGRLRDKLVLRTALKERGLSAVRAELLTEDVLHVRRLSSGRAFIKPRFGIASFGAFALKDSTSWERLLELRREMQADAEYSDYFQADASLIVEDYIEGQEFSFEVLAGGGTIKILAVHEKVELESANETTLETACVSPPSSLDPAQLRAAAAWMAEVLEGLGIAEGCFHAEARFDGTRWEVIEINPRVGGAYILESARQVCGGFSLLDGWLRLLLEPEAAKRREYLDSLSAIGIGAAGAPAGAVRTFFRVFFAQPARTIKDISVRDGFPAPAFSKTFMKAGTATASSSRELFLAQALWKLGADDLAGMQELKLKTRDYYRVEYL